MSAPNAPSLMKSFASAVEPVPSAPGAPKTARHLRRGIAGAARVRLLRSATRTTSSPPAPCTASTLDSAQLDGLPTVPFEELERSLPAGRVSLFVAVGYTDVNGGARRSSSECVELGYHLATLVSSRAHCWDDLRIGRNCLVFDGVVIEPHVEIGDDVIAWSGSQISHDSSVGEPLLPRPERGRAGRRHRRRAPFVGGTRPSATACASPRTA